MQDVHQRRIDVSPQDHRRMCITAGSASLQDVHHGASTVITVWMESLGGQLSG
jgi:hypothetical protein